MYQYTYAMPPRKGKKSYRRRRKYGKKRGQRLTNVNRSLQPFPSRYICKMKYSTTLSIGTGSASFAQQLFRINSMYDPDVTFVGHQPYGRDTLSTIYNRYRIISCRWYIQAISAAGKTQVLAVIPTNETISETDIDALREKPRVRTYVITAGSAGTPQKIKGKCYLPALVGKTASQYKADDRYAAITSTDPAETCYLYLHLQDMDKTTLVQAYASIMLEYTVEWFDSKVLTQS